MIPFSVLDLSPILEGQGAVQSFRNSLSLAQHAEKWGYNRYWLAEHHNMPGIASAATSVLMCHIAQGTKNIRVGAGGIMLPNHSPLVIAEQFGTLATLFPDRIDLGLGRAPGSDQQTSRALRRNMTAGVDEFPNDVQELIELFKPATPGQRIHAIPGEGLCVPVWILGSSLFGAQLAAELGLPYAFASHFAPAMLMPAIEIYRERFRKSEHLKRPYVMLGFNVFAADSDEEGQLLATSMQQTFVNLRSGRPSKLQPPLAGYEQGLGSQEKAILEQTLTCAAIGGPKAVKAALNAFIAKTGPSELMITSQIFDHSKRLRSYEIAATVLRS